MTFQELLGKAKKLNCVESRAQLDHYCEIVVAKDALTPAEALLCSYFGEPLKPKGVAPTADISAQTRPYGGVQANQTMYFRQGTSGGEFAFLWPWGNGLSITVKIMTEKK
ncbi:MAG: hypothetical protein WCO69_06465 [Candidatus Omnitrophota bacterium]